MAKRLAAEEGENVVGFDRHENQDQNRPVVVIVGHVAEVAEAHPKKSKAESAECDSLQIPLRHVAENADGYDDDDGQWERAAEEFPPMIEGPEGDGRNAGHDGGVNRPF